MFLFLTVMLLGTFYVLSKMIIVVPQSQFGIKERLGKFQNELKPGWHFMVPFVDRAAYRGELREQVIDIPSQSCITRDNIQVEVDGIVYLKVINAEMSCYQIDNYKLASINLAQTTMRAEIGKLTLDETFYKRDKINGNIVSEIDKASDPWGVKMIRYEIMNISPSARVVETMEKQMEAERAKRAEITISEGHKEGQIQLSEGLRREAINLSEGQRERSINEAQGIADEIRLIAVATAEGTRLVAAAIGGPGGHLAIKTQLIEQYLESFGKIIQNADVSVLPNELANIQGVFEGVSKVTQQFAP